MSHFSPLSSSSLSTSEINLVAPSYSNLSENEKIVIGLNQNTYSNLAVGDGIMKGQKEIIKATETLYKESLKQSKENLLLQLNVGKQQIKALNEVSYEINSGFDQMSSILYGLGKEIDIRLLALTEQATITNTKLETLIQTL